MDKTYIDALIDNIEEENLEYANERAFRRETKQMHVKNLKLRQDNLRKQISKLAIAGGVLTLVAIGLPKILEKKPLEVVATELLEDANLYETENGKSVDGKMTDQELVDYIKEHELSLDDIKEETIDMLKLNMINPEFGMKEVEKSNPEVFQEDTKGMGR